MTAARILEACARFGELVAIDGAVRLTYAELARASAALSASLAARGVSPGDVVAIDAGRSAAHVLAVLAIWRRGAAFVPLAEEWPAARRDEVLGRTRARVVLDRAAIEAEALAAERRPPVADAPSAADDLAYVIATSGSTGAPKLVAVTHRGLGPLFSAQIDAFRLAPGARALFALSPAFDASISDLGTALLAGATLVAVEPSPLSSAPSAPSLREALEAHAITHADLPPAMLRWLEPPKGLRVVVIGGEVCPPDVVRRWARTVRVVNVYGPTEATICASLCVCDARAWTAPLLGAPIAGTFFRVLDAARDATPPGTAGELYIGGEGLARGYFDAPELTAARFVEVRGERLYRTGDRVVVRGDGALEFLGRVDRQVKLHGRLVEPSEVERALLAHPSVTRACVLPSRTGAARALTAFVALVDGAAIGPAALRAHVAERLPAWMVPARIVTRAGLPETHAGKVDVEALTRELAAPASDRVAGAWSGEAATLAAAVCEALDLADVAANDDLAELGGGSLARIAIVAAAEARGVWLDLEAVGRARTFADVLSARVVTMRAMPIAVLARAVDRELESLPAIAEGASAGGAAIFVTGATGRLGAALIAALLGRTERPVIALVRAPDEASAHARLAATLAAHGIDATRSGRVEILVGDVARPAFGIAPQAYARLVGRVGTVVHAAAGVRFAASFEELHAVNLAGTGAAVALAIAARAALHAISTLSVFTAASPTPSRCDEHDDLPREGALHGGYAQSKWAAEALVRAAAPRLEAVSIHRLGLLTAPLVAVEGHTRADDHLSRVIRGLARLGAVPSGPCGPRELGALRFDVLPIDACADALARLVVAPSARGLRTFHLANRSAATLADLVATLRAAGAGLDELRREDFDRRAERPTPEDPDVALARLAFARERHRALDLFESTNVTLGIAATEAALGGPIVEAPARALLAHCVARALAGVPQ